MTKLMVKDIVRVVITGVQDYGAFASTDNGYVGLIHISEISYGFVKSINEYLNIGDEIYAEVVEIDEKNKKLKLSIKDIDYKNDGERIKRMPETKNGFNPLKDNLEKWISEKIKEITDQI